MILVVIIMFVMVVFWVIGNNCGKKIIMMMVVLKFVNFWIRLVNNLGKKINNYIINVFFFYYNKKELGYLVLIKFKYELVI